MARFEVNGHACRIVTVEDTPGQMFDLYIGGKFHGSFGSLRRCHQEAQSLVGKPWWRRVPGWLR